MTEDTVSQLAFVDLGMCYCYCPAPISSPMSALALMYLHSQLHQPADSTLSKATRLPVPKCAGGATMGPERAARSSLAYLVQETHTTTVCAK